ncbi:hypothetical protein BN903_49 [Halorubrum sp. AJ67]|nr:hypothetical protein BN903_49 [Halorubrum sp. AJ67]
MYTVSNYEHLGQIDLTQQIHQLNQLMNGVIEQFTHQRVE